MAQDRCFLYATQAVGFANVEGSSLGFTSTFSRLIFSTGTGVSLSPVAVVVTGRTLVSRTNGITRPFTCR